MFLDPWLLDSPLLDAEDESTFINLLSFNCMIYYFYCAASACIRVIAFAEENEEDELPVFIVFYRFAEPELSRDPSRDAGPLYLDDLLSDWSSEIGAIQTLLTLLLIERLMVVGALFPFAVIRVELLCGDSRLCSSFECARLAERGPLALRSRFFSSSGCSMRVFFS